MMRGGKKRSLMIKLSPDLVFDRSRSYTAMTRRSQTHTCTHRRTRSPSDKPNYDPVSQPNYQNGERECVCVCTCVCNERKANKKSSGDKIKTNVDTAS